MIQSCEQRAAHLFRIPVEVVTGQGLHPTLIPIQSTFRLERATMLVCVIGDPNALRNPTLISDLESELSTSPVVLGVFPKETELFGLYEAAYAKAIYGTFLTAGEIGCWHSHRLAYQLAIQSGTRALLVLEDDAEVDSGFGQEILDLCHQMKSFVGPVVVSLFDSQSIVVKRSFSWERDKPATSLDTQQARPFLVVPQVRPPQGTVGYLMNRACIDVAVSVPRVCVTPADWPTWSGEVRWFKTDPALIRHGTAPSFLAKRPVRKPSRRFMRLIGAVSFGRWFRFRKYYPSLRGYIRREILFRLVR